MAVAVKHAAKSVSWAPGLKLCQVRLFLSEDAPALSGFATQDHLQAKASRLFHVGGGENDESLPPGFETPYHMNIKQLKYETSLIKLSKWKCPAKFFLDTEWLVVSGDESEEVEAENKRQLGTLEAIYPRTSSIPLNPSVSTEVERTGYDDSRTPIVPIIAVEEEEMDMAWEVPPAPEHSTPEQSRNSSACFIPSVSHGLLHPQGNATKSAPPNHPSAGLPSIPIIPGVEPDVAAAASAVFTAIMKSNDKGSLIDHELLIKILSDPKTVEKLILENGVQSQVPTLSSPSQVPASSATIAPTVSLQSHIPISAPLSAPPSHVTYNDPSFSAGSNGRIFPSQNMFPTQHPTNPPSLPLHPQSNNMPIRQPSPMDPNYINKSTAHSQGVEDLAHYKSLIHQHGGEYNLPENRDTYPSQYFNAGHRNRLDRGEFQQEALEQKRDAKISRRLKSTNHCIYYHSAKGCKKGSNCTYVHDPSVPQRLGDMRDNKRIKLDRD